MFADKDWKAKLKLLKDLAMRYEVAVKPLYEKDYLKEFYDFYEIRNRKAIYRFSMRMIGQYMRTNLKRKQVTDM